MDKRRIVSLAQKVSAGKTIDLENLREIACLPDHEVPTLLAGSEMVREARFGIEIQLCTIRNGKSGRCSEDCTFCSQSAFSRTDSPVYPLLDGESLQEGGRRAAESPINRYSIVTSGRGLPHNEVAAVANALGGLNGRISTCASLGILGDEDFKTLKRAGVSRYHHNLETSESYFGNMCTTHSYEERIQTVRKAKKFGLSVCSGGVFGIGETDEQVLELALTLRDLQVDAVPINFLVPIKGTPLADVPRISPFRCLKTIALFRFVLPDKEIIVCGGREANLKEFHPLVFKAGANGIMTGNYLTTEGRTLEKDLEMIRKLGLRTSK